MKKFLKSKGFKFLNFAPYQLILEIMQQRCAMNPYDSACTFVPLGGTWPGYIDIPMSKNIPNEQTSSMCPS